MIILEKVKGDVFYIIHGHILELKIKQVTKVNNVTCVCNNGYIVEVKSYNQVYDTYYEATNIYDDILFLYKKEKLASVFAKNSTQSIRNFTQSSAVFYCRNNRWHQVNICFCTMRNLCQSQTHRFCISVVFQHF